MKNDNRKSLSSYRELHNCEIWRGAWRGGGFLRVQEVERYFGFASKTHIFKATGGAIKEGRVEGRSDGGANGGAIFRIHGGAMEGRPTHL